MDFIVLPCTDWTGGTLFTMILIALLAQKYPTALPLHCSICKFVTNEATEMLIYLFIIHD